MFVRLSPLPYMHLKLLSISLTVLVIYPISPPSLRVLCIYTLRKDKEWNFYKKISHHGKFIVDSLSLLYKTNTI